MKKRTLALLLVFTTVFSLFAFTEASAAAEMKIYRLTTPPTLDGQISDGEYFLLTGSDYPYTLGDNAENDAANAKTNIYAGYDDDYLYVAATVTCECHVNEWVFVADGGENDYDIFDGHCMAVSVTSVNPATDKDCLDSILKEDFSWSDGFKTAIGRSFTLALTSDTGIQLSGVHYSHTTNYVPESDIYTDPKSGATIRYNCANDANLPMQKEFFHVAHDDGQQLDIYEVRIPWGWIDYKTDRAGNKGENIIPFDRKDGTYCGLSVSLNTGDIDQDIYFNGGLASIVLGSGNAQFFGNYIPLFLAGTGDGEVEAVVTTTVQTTTTESTTTTEATTTTTEAASEATTTTTRDAASTSATTAATSAADEEAESSNTGLIIAIIAAAAVIIAAVVIIIVSKKKKASK